MIPLVSRLSAILTISLASTRPQNNLVARPQPCPIRVQILEDLIRLSIYEV